MRRFVLSVGLLLLVCAPSLASPAVLADDAIEAEAGDAPTLDALIAAAEPCELDAVTGRAVTVATLAPRDGPGQPLYLPPAAGDEPVRLVVPRANSPPAYFFATSPAPPPADTDNATSFYRRV